MSDRIEVDTEALRRGGVRLDQTADAAHQIHADVSSATEAYQGAGGTGQMGKVFDNGYRPSERKAMEFLDLLDTTLSEIAGRTGQTANNFAATDDDASRSVQGL